MAFSYGAKSQINAQTGNPITLAHTTIANTKLLVVGIITKTNTARTGGAPTYNGTGMTQVPCGTMIGSGECTAELWYLSNPSIGAYNVSVPNSGGLTITVIASSYVDAGVSGAALDVYNSTNVSGANPSLQVDTGYAGEVIVNVFGSGYTSVGTGNKTLLYRTDEGVWSSHAQYELQALAGLTTFTWTQPTDDVAFIVGAFKGVTIYTGYTPLAQLLVLIATKYSTLLQTLTLLTQSYSTLAQNVHLSKTSYNTLLQNITLRAASYNTLAQTLTLFKTGYSTLPQNIVIEYLGFSTLLQDLILKASGHSPLAQDLNLTISNYTPLSQDLVLSDSEYNTLAQDLILKASGYSPISQNLALEWQGYTALPQNTILSALSYSSLKQDLAVADLGYNTIAQDIILKALGYSTLQQNVEFEWRGYTALAQNLILSKLGYNTLPQNLTLQSSKYNTLIQNLILSSSDYNTLAQNIILFRAGYNTLPQDLVLQLSNYSNIPQNLVLKALGYSALQQNLDLNYVGYTGIPQNLILSAMGYNTLKQDLTLVISGYSGYSTLIQNIVLAALGYSTLRQDLDIEWRGYTIIPQGLTIEAGYYSALRQDITLVEISIGACFMVTPLVGIGIIPIITPGLYADGRVLESYSGGKSGSQGAPTNQHDHPRNIKYVHTGSNSTFPYTVTITGMLANGTAGQIEILTITGAGTYIGNKAWAWISDVDLGTGIAGGDLGELEAGSKLGYPFKIPNTNDLQYAIKNSIFKANSLFIIDTTNSTVEEIGVPVITGDVFLYFLNCHGAIS